MKQINLDSAKALDFVGFKLKENNQTTNNYFRKDNNKHATFFSFMLVLCNPVFRSTTEDLSLQRYEMCNPYYKGKYIEIKKFSN